MSPLRDRTELSVGVVVFPNAMALDFIGPVSYLELLRKLGVCVTIHSISFAASPITFAGRLPLVASSSYNDIDPESLDILVLPGGSGRQAVLQDPGFLRFIQRAAETAQFVLSVCTGASLLAAVGLLDGRRATTNKMAFETLAREYPRVLWTKQARWCVDGKFWTGSGVAAGLDMAHAFVADQYGAQAADAMARYMEIEPIKDPSHDPFAASGETPLVFQ